MAVCGRNGSILVERYAYVLFFAPDDVAGDAHAVCLKYQREILGDVGAVHVKRPETGHQFSGAFKMTRL